MHQVKLNLSEAQLRKLSNRHNIQVRPDQIGFGFPVALSDKNLKKIENSYNKSKGMRLTLDDDEIEGGNLKQNIRSAFNKTKKQVKKTLKDPNLGRKVKNTSRKVKNTVNDFAVVGDLGIPVVSDSYNLLNTTTRLGDKLVRSGVDHIEDRKDEKKRSQFVNDFNSLREHANTQSSNSPPTEGSGNPYLPSKQVKKVKKKLTTGSSFRTLGAGVIEVDYKGKKPVKLKDDGSNLVRAGHPGFDPGISSLPNTCCYCSHCGKKK